jgi:rubrerythrin
MAYDFNADEIFEMAVQIEINGAKFYKKAADTVSDPSAKQFLVELAQMEAEHEKTFLALKKDLADKEKKSTIFDPDGDAVEYLHALAGTRVFFEKKMDTSSLKEIFKDALTAEKDSIVFYLGMKELVPDHLGKDKIENIIKEEMKHISSLGLRLSDLGN